MEWQIRPASLADLPYIYHICLKTGLSGKDASDFVQDPYILGQYFAVPYLHFEIDLCFVVTNDHIPVGYIVGVSNTEAFNTWMNNRWLPKIQLLYPAAETYKSDLEKFVYGIINRECILQDFLQGYPGHLHIDLLPQIQGQGVGRKLLEKFIFQLKKNGSVGVHLSVGEKNSGAIKFYEKCGFLHLKRQSAAIFMGIKF